MSTFSASSTSVCQFIPVSLFTRQIQCPVSGYSDIEEHLKQMMPATCDGQFSLEGEDLAVWLLVSSSSDFDSQDYMSGDCDLNPVGRWRLALMVKNTMIFGSTLDPRCVDLFVHWNGILQLFFGALNFMKLRSVIANN